ncbi:unnamed protein product [Spirodela intermedia]|uniref:Uncharacterized protein n=1 Tax=Spirodela intermedia TaxID=51605 RepID=A0A7I8IVG7_SPIIN|nr:unnamed protein product [Spirodela intermedia]CAA6661986.1 unnamed protein product [Spirodela intermedia]
MDAESWNRPAGSSRRHQNALQSRFDREDDSRTEFPCPYCSEDFDMAGLCHHITEEHTVEAKNGVCPICEVRVGMDILDYVGHITMMHGHLLKISFLSFSRSPMPHSTLSLLKKELREGHLPSLLGGSSYTASASNTAPDPLLSSFMYNSLATNSFKDVQPQTSDISVENKKLHKKTIERYAALTLGTLNSCIELIVLKVI